MRWKWLPHLPSQGLMLKAFDDYLELRRIKLMLILRREENSRIRRKTLESRKRPTTTTLLTSVPSFLRMSTRGYTCVITTRPDITP